MGKNIVEYEEFDLLEDNLKDYKKKRPKPLLILLSIVSTLFSLYSLARIYPSYVEAIVPGFVFPGVYLNKGFGGLNIGVPPVGSMMIDGVEVDLVNLKEDFGIMYTIIVPMSKQEARKQLRKAKNFEYNQDYNVTPMFGYTIELDEDETKEYWMLVSSTIKMIKEIDTPINNEFVELVQELIQCNNHNYYDFESCYFGHTVGNFSQYQHISDDLLKRYSHELDLKSILIRFEVFKEYVQSKGYNLEDYLPDPKELNLSFD